MVGESQYSCLPQRARLFAERINARRGVVNIQDVLFMPIPDLWDPRQEERRNG